MIQMIQRTKRTHKINMPGWKMSKGKGLLTGCAAKMRFRPRYLRHHRTFYQSRKNSVPFLIPRSVFQEFANMESITTTTGVTTGTCVDSGDAPRWKSTKKKNRNGKQCSTWTSSPPARKKIGFGNRFRFYIMITTGLSSSFLAAAL